MREKPTAQERIKRYCHVSLGSIFDRMCSFLSCIYKISKLIWCGLFQLFTSKMAHKRNKRSSSAGPSNRSSHHSSSSSVYLDFLGRQSTPTEASTSSSIRSDFLGRRSSRSVSLSSANSPVQQKTARVS